MSSFAHIACFTQGSTTCILQCIANDIISFEYAENIRRLFTEGIYVINCLTILGPVFFLDNLLQKLSLNLDESRDMFIQINTARPLFMRNS